MGREQSHIGILIRLIQWSRILFPFISQTILVVPLIIRVTLAGIPAIIVAVAVAMRFEDYGRDEL